MTRFSIFQNISQKFRQKQLVSVLAVAIGFISGLVAVLLKNGVYWIQWLLENGISKWTFGYMKALYPMMGILLTIWIIRRILKKNPGAGIPSTLYAISKRKSTLKRHNIYSAVITSICTVGFGGSAGLEAPTVQTSAAIGSNLGKAFKLNYKTKTLLIGCAAAGALASIFKAPVAAIIFAVEVIMIDLTTASLIPILLASISALLTANWFLGEETLLRFHLKDDFELAQLPYFIILGIFTGLCSIYFTKIYISITSFLAKIKNMLARALTGGVLLTLVILFFPPLFGEGYEVMNAFLNNTPEHIINESPIFVGINNEMIFLIFLIGVAFFKVIATGLTIGSGGIGGIFAPTLFMGSALGYVFARFINYFELKELSLSNFTLVGMAGMMAGVLHAPLTAIFMIAEITGGYDLFLPLMLTAAIAYSTSRALAPHTIYTQELALKGELITHDKDKAVLTLMDLRKEIETGFVTVFPDDSLGNLVLAVSNSPRNLFPVVNPTGNLVGVVTLNDIRQVMFEKELYETTEVHDYMTLPPELIYLTDTMDEVMRKFDESEAWNLPVIEQGKYKGFVSKSKLFSAYRKQLQETTLSE